MAIYRLNYKCGKNAVAHLTYIMREERYKKNQDLVYEETFNLPEEFEDIKDFWLSAELLERKNANIYREFEITLAREFSNENNKKILELFLT